MTARFAASILAFCIALPMCWCCLGAPKQAPKQAHTCCTSSHSTQPQTPAQDPQCPCASHGDSRDTTNTLVAVPTPALKLLPATTWHAGALQIPFPAFRVQSSTPLHDHGPPGVITPPLYTQHCALLI